MCWWVSWMCDCSRQDEVCQWGHDGTDSLWVAAGRLLLTSLPLFLRAPWPPCPSPCHSQPSRQVQGGRGTAGRGAGDREADDGERAPGHPRKCLQRDGCRRQGWSVRASARVPSRPAGWGSRGGGGGGVAATGSCKADCPGDSAHDSARAPVPPPRTFDRSYPCACPPSPPTSPVSGVASSGSPTPAAPWHRFLRLLH